MSRAAGLSRGAAVGLLLSLCLTMTKGHDDMTPNQRFEIDSCGTSLQQDWRVGLDVVSPGIVVAHMSL